MNGAILVDRFCLEGGKGDLAWSNLGTPSCELKAPRRGFPKVLPGSDVKGQRHHENSKLTHLSLGATRSDPAQSPRPNAPRASQKWYCSMQSLVQSTDSDRVDVKHLGGGALPKTCHRKVKWCRCCLVTVIYLLLPLFATVSQNLEANLSSRPAYGNPPRCLENENCCRPGTQLQMDQDTYLHWYEACSCCLHLANSAYELFADLEKRRCISD